LPQEFHRSRISEIQSDYTRPTARHIERLFPRYAEWGQRIVLAELPDGVVFLKNKVAVFFNQFKKGLNRLLDDNRCVHPEYEMIPSFQGFIKAKRLKCIRHLLLCGRPFGITRIPCDKISLEMKFVELLFNSPESASKILE
jgi:hypothetical protein